MFKGLKDRGIMRYMKFGYVKTYLLPLTALFALMFFFVVSKTGAQSTNDQIILTWQANNFYPADFEGKAFPSPGSEVVVSLGVIKNGKLADLTSSSIAWSLDGNFMERGLGKQTFSFFAKKTSSGSETVRVSVENGNAPLEYSVNIPVVDPQVVVEIPYFENIVPSNTDITLRAVPYFFNVTSLNDLTFMWQIGGMVEKHEGDGSLSLHIEKPGVSGRPAIFIKTSVQNKNDVFEYMNQNTTLTTQ